MEVAGANRRWRCQFRYRGSRRESAVAQLSTLDGYDLEPIQKVQILTNRDVDCNRNVDGLLVALFAAEHLWRLSAG